MKIGRGISYNIVSYSTVFMENKIRDPVLEKFKATFLTRIGHAIARRQKKIEKKSIMQIIEDALVDKYGKQK